MVKKRLFTPGPTEVPASVFKAMNTVEHHRTSSFQKNMKDVQEGLQYIFQTKEPVLTLASTGTGAMEAAVTNLFKKGDVVLVVVGGKFGERWEELSRTYGLEVLSLNVKWGQAVTLSQIKEVFQKHRSIKGVLIQASETSTGVAHPIKETAAFLQNYPETLFVVDAISALVTMPLPMDEWKIDALLASSQKGLMLPPGLSFIALSKKAWERAEASDLPKYYFNLIEEKKSVEKSTTTFTTPVTLILGLKEALRLLKSEGLENSFKKYNLFSKAVRSALTSWGLKLFAESPAPGLTAVLSPQNIKSSLIVNALAEKFDITIAAGQEELKDKIFRLSYMGDINAEDVLYLLRSLQTVLLDLGVNINTKRALEGAQEILNP